MRSCFNDPQMSAPRILVVKLSSIGDLFHALPAVRMIKQELGATVDWVTQAPYRELVQCFEDVSNVIVYPRHGFLQGALPMMRELRRQPYDLVLDFQGLFKSAVVTRLSRSSRKIGPSYHREGSRFAYTEVAGIRDRSRHAVEQALDVVDHLAIARTDVRFPVVYPATSVPEGGSRVALIPCSRWETKNWPVEHFVEVGQSLAGQGVQIFLVGGSEDLSVCKRLEDVIPGAINLCGKTNLVTLGATLQVMDLVVTVDTGPMHMAAAAGVPVLAIFGATDPLRTGPYGASHVVLTVGELTCRPCLSRTCARGDLACLREIPPARVVDQACAMLANAE